MLGRRRSLLAFRGAATAIPELAGGTRPVATADPQVRQALAPTGTLRVAVYAGSPTSLVIDAASGETRGMGVDIGKELARRLGVPFQQVEFPRPAAVLEALKAVRVDCAVTNATPARAADVDFTSSLVELEQGYIVVPGSRVISIADVDQPGVRVGVSQGSTSQSTLTRRFRNAVVVPAPSLNVATEMLAKGELDTFATNKAILFDMADGLHGAVVLDGRWGVEQLAIAIPKGRDAGLSFLRAFAIAALAEGVVRRAVERAALRGTVEAARWP